MSGHFCGMMQRAERHHKLVRHLREWLILNVKSTRILKRDRKQEGVTKWQPNIS
jgi:hypothetical protein